MPDQLLQWGGMIASGGSTAVVHGAYQQAKVGRALLVCDAIRFFRMLESWPVELEWAGEVLRVVLLSKESVVTMHQDLSTPCSRFDYIGTLGAVTWEVSQVLLALLAPGGKIRSRPDVASQHMGDLWFPGCSATPQGMLETLGARL